MISQDAVDVLMAIGPRTTETMKGLLTDDEWEEYPVWPLAFFTAAESGPDFQANLLFQESDNERHFVAVGATDPDQEDTMEKIIEAENDPKEKADLYGKIARLLDYATEQMEEGNLKDGQIFLWSAL